MIDQRVDETRRDDAAQHARERAEMIQGLYIHFFVFAVINGGLFLINWATRGDGGGWWFVWPTLIWSVALLVHVIATVFPVFSESWVDRKARQLAERGRQ